MSTAEPFPVFFPSDARRVFGSEDFVRRIGRVAQWSNGSRLLELCGGSAGIVLAREQGCAVTVVDSDEKAVEGIKERVKANGLADRVEARRVDFAKLPFSDGEFDGIFALGRVPMPLSVALVALRRHLAPMGRLVLTYPMKVGRYPAQNAIEFWQKKIGEPLLLPQQVLLELEKAGYEPETVETMNDAELNDYYRDLEPSLGIVASEYEKDTKVLRDELALHRQQGGKASATFGLLVGRRKEPNEKPPAARDVG